MDGHNSHLTGKFLGFCHDHKILPLCLPAHATHALQPLDVGCFGPLSHYYKKGVEESARQGIYGISKHEFLEIYGKARIRGLSPSNILSAWRKAGLFPYDPARVMEEYTDRPKTPECPSHSMNDSLLETPKELLKTPTSSREIQHTLKRLRESNGSDFLQATPTKMRIMKLGKAAEITMASNTILQKEIVALTKANCARKQRWGLNATVLSKAQVLDMVEIEKIREREQKRQEDKDLKACRIRDKASRNSVVQEPEREDVVGQQAEEVSRTVAEAGWNAWTGIIEF
jgi:hypothetical protein